MSAALAHEPYERERVLAPISRWTPKRRMLALVAIERGTVTREELMAAHNVSAQELDAWRRHLEPALRSHGRFA